MQSEPATDTLSIPDTATIDARKAAAATWFAALRDRICAAFEALEDAAPASLYPGAAGRFERTPWTRPAAPGYRLSLIHI